MRYNGNLTFSEWCLGWLQQDAKIPEFILEYLENLALWHGQAGKGLEERDRADVEMVA